MAKKKKTASRTRTVVVQPAKAAAPIIRVSAPRAAPITHRRKRRVSGSAQGGGLKDMVGAGVGGAVFGYIETHFPNLPTLPVLGRAGTVALACHFLRKQGGFGHGALVRDVGMAAAVIAGYQLGKTGKIAGDDDVGELSQQI
jgi:hypothetical protein